MKFRCSLIYNESMSQSLFIILRLFKIDFSSNIINFKFIFLNIFKMDFSFDLSTSKKSRLDGVNCIFELTFDNIIVLFYKKREGYGY